MAFTLGRTVDIGSLAQSISALPSHPVVKGLTQSILSWKQQNPTLIYVLFALAVGFAFGRYLARHASRTSAFQNRGEAVVSRVTLTNFGPPEYHLLNHVTLRMRDGTTQVDHILVSRFGVFVIETKNYKGWIFANAKQANWTQVLFNYKFKFQNPILQNFRHVLAVQDLLDFLPPGAIKSAVVFTGEAHFKTGIPEGVFTVPGFIDHIRAHTVEIMSLNRVQFCVGRLETARLAISGQTDVEHIESLARRHGGAV